jgi:hypothetical protein
MLPWRGRFWKLGIRLARTANELDEGSIRCSQVYLVLEFVEQ